MLKFGKNILNGKQLRSELGISTTLYYQLVEAGMPCLQLSPNSRKYYSLEDVEHWLIECGLHKKTHWTK